MRLITLTSFLIYTENTPKDLIYVIYQILLINILLIIHMHID